jgi:outer membrane beta-barrel protein
MHKFSFLAIGLALFFSSKDIHAGEKSLYDFLWLDPDKKVYVLQNKLHKKEHTFYLDIGYLSNFTSKFQETSGVQARAGFYIHEEWGLEVFHNSYSNSNNDEFNNIKSVNGVIPFIRRLKSNTGILAIWSPFYGKINTFNQIFYFDWSFGAGVSSIAADSNLKSVTKKDAPNKFYSENYAGAVLKTNLKFHLTENIHLSLEYMNTYYRAPGAKNPKSDSLRTNTDVITSIGFSY